MARTERGRSLPRRLLVGLLAMPALLVLMIIGAGIWMTWFLDLNDHKPLIRRLAQEQLGIEVTLNGKLGHRLDATRLRLSAQDLSAVYDGRPVASIDQLELDLALAPLLHGAIVIERIQGRARALDLEWDAAGVFNLIPTLTTDTDTAPTPGPAAMPEWLRTLRIDHIQAEVGDGRYQDHEFGLDLRLKGAAIDIGPLPIIDQGRLVADTPALFGAYRGRWAIEAESVRFWNLTGSGVDVVVDSDHGSLRFSRLRADTVEFGGPPGDPFIEVAKANIGGRLVVDYGVPVADLQATPWQAPLRLELDALAVSARSLSIGQGDARLRLDGLHANTARLSLVPGLRALTKGGIGGVDGWSRLLPKGLSTSGKALRMGNIRLADYALSITAGKTLGIKLAKGQLRIGIGIGIGVGDTAAGDPVLSAQLRGEAQLAPLPGSSPVQPGLDLIRLQLQASDTVIGAPGDRYRAATLSVDAAAVPILRDGAVLDTSDAGALIEAVRKLRLSVVAKDISHRSDTDPIDALSVTLEGRGRSLALTSLKARIDDTVLNGTGELALSAHGPTRRPTWRLKLDSTGVSVGELARLTDLPLTPRGRLAVDLDLSGEGFDQEQLTHTLAGSLVMVSEGIELLDLDLDKLLTHLQYTQQGNLWDISLFLLTGPAGSLLQAASDFRKVVETAGAQGSSRILAMRSEVRFEHGVLRVEEAALSTRNHRLAIQGSLSLYGEGPADLTIATVDGDGCTLFRERITGTLAEPDISNGGVLAKTLLLPLKTLASSLLPGRRCIKPFYSGSVAAPPEHPNEPRPH